MSCESGGVKVDHACSGPNSCPIVTSFGFENRPLRLCSLACGLARARCPSSVAPGSPSHRWPALSTIGQTRWFSSRPSEVATNARNLRPYVSTTGAEIAKVARKTPVTKAKNAGYPVWNTPLATPKTFLASSSCFIARTMSALGADNRSCNILLRNLPIP
jgi:hypothetical protein